MQTMLGQGNKTSYCLALCMVSHGVWQVFGYRGEWLDFLMCICLACAKL